MTPQQFFDQAWPLALQASADCDIWPDIIFAQSALETGYGAHAPQNNYFGIKGPGGSVITTEYVDGHPVKMPQRFEGYPSMALSFMGYAVFMQRNERYAKAREWGPNRLHTTDEITLMMANQLHAICDAGYATDPKYYNKVASILWAVPKYRAAHNTFVAKVRRTFAPMPTVYPVAMLNLPPVPVALPLKQDTEPMSDFSKWLGAHASALTNAANVLKEVAGAVPIPAAQALAGVISGIEGMASNVGAVAASPAASPTAPAPAPVVLEPAPQTGVLATVETDAFNAVIDAEQAAFRDLMDGHTQNIVGDMVQAAEVGAFGTKPAGSSN